MTPICTVCDKPVKQIFQEREPAIRATVLTARCHGAEKSITVCDSVFEDAVVDALSNWKPFAAKAGDAP